MKKIALYYIATNIYIEFFEEFLESVHHFFPGVEKKIVLMTDCDEINFKGKSKKGIEVVQHHIDHHYWPVPTLFKMFYIDKFFAVDCDYHFYFNANFVLEKDYFSEQEFDMYFMEHYFAFASPFQDINKPRESCVIPPATARCHISDEEIPEGTKYLHAAFFGGKTIQMKRLLKEVNDMIREDLSNNIIANWHDETYLNRYMISNYWNGNKIGKVEIIHMSDYADLTNKIFNKYDLP